MKKFKLIALLIPISILFMGCPYTTEVSIDTASIKINPKLIGKWESKSSSTDTYDISKGDDFTYNIDKKNTSNTEVTHYKAFMSDVSGTKFLNLWEEGSGSTTKSYYLYKFTESPSGSKITLAEVTENIDEKFATSAELKKYIQANMNLSFFYTKGETEYFRAD